MLRVELNAIDEQLGRMEASFNELDKSHALSFVSMEKRMQQQAAELSAMVAAVQQAQVQLATSDQQQEGALLDLAERVNRQTEILGRLVEQNERRAVPAAPISDPWTPPDLAARIAGLQREFTQRRANDAQAMQIPTPEVN